MAKNLHIIKLTDLEVIALASSEPKPTEEGSIFGQLLQRAYFSAKEQLETIAKTKIIGDDSITAPADEFDNPPVATVPIDPNYDGSPVRVESEKTETATAKKGKFQPSVE